jgi:hypothetical protein
MVELFFKIYIDVCVCVCIGKIDRKTSKSHKNHISIPHQNKAVTYIGAAQTASHGSGDAGTCGDFIVRLTIVDSWGNIKSLDRYEGGKEGGEKKGRDQTITYSYFN